MQLGLTFPLQRKLKIKFVPYGTPLERLYCWDLHCITLRGQDSLLLIHCASRYTVVACGVTRFDWENLPGFAMEQIRSGLLDAGLPEQVIEDYLRAARAPDLTRTHGRRVVAFLNRAWDDVLALLEQAVNSVPCRCAGFEGREAAKQHLYRSFELI